MGRPGCSIHPQSDPLSHGQAAKCRGSELAIFARSDSVRRRPSDECPPDPEPRRLRSICLQRFTPRGATPMRTRATPPRTRSLASQSGYPWSSTAQERRAPSVGMPHQVRTRWWTGRVNLWGRRATLPMTDGPAGRRWTWTRGLPGVVTRVEVRALGAMTGSWMAKSRSEGGRGYWPHGTETSKLVMRRE